MVLRTKAQMARRQRRMRGLCEVCGKNARGRSTCRRCHRNKYRREKRNPNSRIAAGLRARLRVAIRREYRAGSAVRMLGCSIRQFRKWLQSKFLPGMTWQNYGRWHIDHVRPLSSFNLRDARQLAKACHFSNLQPLWAEDNLRKSNFSAHRC